MKVAFPTNNGEKIAKHASLCKSFLIVDTETGESMTVSNPLKDEKIIPHRGDHHGEKLHRGTGRIVPQLLAEQGVAYYVCLEAGEGLQSRLRSSGISVSVVTEKRIDEVLKQLGDLQPAKWHTEAPVATAFGRGGHRREGQRCDEEGRGGRGRGHGCGDRHGRNREGGHGRGRRARCQH
jgi:predicted Fe-Mo cluster-binding NifX family protein